MHIKQFFKCMIKIPAFIIGGLLILTGIAGYLFQEPGLSIKITGPLAEDAQLTLSDGNQSHELDLGYASSDAAGEQAYWLIYNLNLNHAKDASQGNYAIDQGATDRGYIEKSFWYASSKGETMKALKQESDNFQGAGDGDPIEIDWANVDQNSSKIRFIYKEFADSSGPVTLQANNWKNIDITPKPKPNEKIEFGTSPTAFIPGILGIILILLTLGADKFPKGHKHFMHAAVLVALICFFVVTKMLLDAYSEMTLLKEEPYMIIHISSLKPTVMLLSAGLLLIFVILCVVSFIEARKNRVAEEKKNTKKPSNVKVSPEKDRSDTGTKDKKSDDSKKEDKDSSKSSNDSKSDSSPSNDKQSSTPSEKKVVPEKKTVTEGKKVTQIESSAKKENKSEPHSGKPQSTASNPATKQPSSTSESVAPGTPPSSNKSEEKKPSEPKPKENPDKNESTENGIKNA